GLPRGARGLKHPRRGDGAGATRRDQLDQLAALSVDFCALLCLRCPRLWRHGRFLPCHVSCHLPSDLPAHRCARVGPAPTPSSQTKRGPETVFSSPLRAVRLLYEPPAIQPPMRVRTSTAGVSGCFNVAEERGSRTHQGPARGPSRI